MNNISVLVLYLEKKLPQTSTFQQAQNGDTSALILLFVLGVTALISQRQRQKNIEAKKNFKMENKSSQ